MSILLTALKITGIVLLVVLAIVLIVVLYVLFVPLRYIVSGSYEESLSFDAVIRDLLGIVKLKYIYDNGESESDMTVFGFSMNRGKDEEYDESDESETDDEWETEDEPSPDQEEEPDYIEPDAEDDESEELTEDSEDTGYEDEEDAFSFTDEDLDAFDENDKKEKKESGIVRRAKSFRNLIDDERNRRAIVYIFNVSLILIKKILPSIRHCDVTFSTGSCSMTGQVTGALAMLPFCYGRDIRIIPDFEADDPYGRGSLSAAGKIPLNSVLMFFLKLYFDKDSRRFIGKIRNR